MNNRLSHQHLFGSENPGANHICTSHNWNPLWGVSVVFVLGLQHNPKFIQYTRFTKAALTCSNPQWVPSTHPHFLSWLCQFLVQSWHQRNSKENITMSLGSSSTMNDSATRTVSQKTRKNAKPSLNTAPRKWENLLRLWKVILKQIGPSSKRIY